MKNLTDSQKVEILKEVQRVLDQRDVEVYSSMSREMREVTPPDAEAATFEPTGAVGICVSVVSAPALLWPQDVVKQSEEEKERLDVLQRVRQLPGRWAKSAELASGYGAGTTVIEKRLGDDLRSFIPELFEE